MVWAQAHSLTNTKEDQEEEWVEEQEALIHTTYNQTSQAIKRTVKVFKEALDPQAVEWSKAIEALVVEETLNYPLYQTKWLWEA